MATKKPHNGDNGLSINKSTAMAMLAFAGYLFTVGMAWQRFVQVEKDVANIDTKVNTIETSRYNTDLKLVEITAKLSELSRGVDKMVIQIETLTKK